MVKKRLFPIALLLIALSITTYFVYRYLHPPALKPGNYSTSVAGFGTVYSSVPATGIVNPENEVLLLSPSSSIVSNIYPCSRKPCVKRDHNPDARSEIAYPGN